MRHKKKRGGEKNVKFQVKGHDLLNCMNKYTVCRCTYVKHGKLYATTSKILYVKTICLVYLFGRVESLCSS